MTPERFAKLRSVLDRRQPDLTVLMENTHKTHNIAAIVRSCDAVGVHRLHAVSEEHDVPQHHMVSGGSRKWVKVRTHASVEAAIAQLRESGHQLLAAHQSDSARDYREVDYCQPTALLFGSELPGVSERAAMLSDLHVAIPMQGLVSSLNVSVAAALILFEARRQREAAGMYSARPRLDPESYRLTLFEWAWPELAHTCRRRGLPYPALDDEGNLLENPLAPSTQHRSR